MTRRFISGRLAAAAVLLAVPVLGVAAATPAAAAECNGVQVTGNISDKLCIAIGENKVLLDNRLKASNVLTSRLELGVDYAIGQDFTVTLEPGAEVEFDLSGVATVSVKAG
ncbi:hypothetical protein ACWD11_34520 [Streptomyces sp. NPDC002776]